MKALRLEMNRPIGLISPFTALLAVLAGVLTLATPQAEANETVVWDRQALGQTNYCHNGTPWYWPNNNYWSQSQVMGDPCSEGAVVTQPSNWSTTNYPDGANYDVILGSMGGAPADLDLQVTLNSLTFQSGGGLTMSGSSRLTANTISFLDNGSVTLVNGGGYAPVMTLATGGTMTKSGGAGAFVLDPNLVLISYAGNFSVASGTLALPGNGSYYANGNFVVASGATLTLLPASQSVTFDGLFSGSGAGTVSMNAGTLAAGADGATLNFPGSLFQWTGGTMVSMANQGTITVSGVGGVSLGGAFNNAGTLQINGTATMTIPGSAHFENETGGIYNFEGDGGVAPGGGSGNTPYFQNFGLLRKSSGSGTSTINSLFNNQQGTIEVDAGTLSLAGSGSSSNGTFNVASGAVLDLTGGSNPTWAGQVNGSGAGQVQLGGGTVNTSPSLALNLPDGMFQWTGGWLAGTTINSNAVTIAGSGSVRVAGGFYNRSLVHHTGIVTLVIPGSSYFENDAGGTYNLEGDGGVAPGCCGGNTPYFQNFGLLRKSSGTGTSTFSVPFNNLNGSIEVDSGTLSLSGAIYSQAYSQGTGALTIKLGGRGAGQSGQLSVSGGASLSGPLNVSLANGFAPVPGDQFQILSSSGRSGTFTALNVPAGISVTYSNNGVYLIVTRPVLAQIVNPVVSGGNLTFSLDTVNNQSYIVQHNDDLATINWVFDTNFTGNGSLMQVVAPVTNVPMRFFRVWEP